LAYFAISVPIIFYVGVYLRFVTNMPFGDDYDAILFWTCEFFNSDSLHHRFLLLFKQHNEHRIVTNYLVNLLSMIVFHRINFIFIKFIGQIGLFLIFATLLFVGGRNKLSAFELIPIPFLLFCLSQVDLMACAMTAVQQYWQLLFDILSILFLTTSRSRAGFATACAFAVLATYSGGGGLLVFPVGFLYLILGRKFSLAIIWLFVTTVALYLFFIYLKYQFSSYGPAAHTYFWAHPRQSIFFIAGFLGNAAQPAAIAIGTGFLLLTATLVVLAIDFRKSDATLIYIALFLLLSGTVVAQNREFVVAQFFLTSRYTIYGLTSFAIVYILVMSSIHTGRLRLLIQLCGIFGAVIINLSFINSGLTALKSFHKIEKVQLVPQPFQSMATTLATLNAAMRQGIFFPAYMYKNLPSKIINNQQYYQAWGQLFCVYLARNDLSAAFPLSNAQSYKPLLQWAANSSAKNNPGYAELVPYLPIYQSMVGIFTH